MTKIINKFTNILENIKTENDKPLITPEFKYPLYEVITGYLELVNTDQINEKEAFSIFQNYINSRTFENSSDFVLNLPKNSKYWWQVRKEIDMAQIKIDVGKGLYICPRPNCRSDQTTYVFKQTRGSDEPATTIVTCESCGMRWTQ